MSTLFVPKFKKGHTIRVIKSSSAFSVGEIFVCLNDSYNTFGHEEVIEINCKQTKWYASRFELVSREGPWGII